MSAVLTETTTKETGAVLADAPVAKFNIRDRVLDVLADTDSAIADPAVIAEMVARTLTNREIRTALATVLPDYVRRVAGDLAGRSRKPQAKVLTTPQRVASWYASVLAARMFNGAEWKFLRDCTADDLHGAAAQRYKTAASTQQEADRLTTLAELLEKLGAETVAEVPEDELRSVLGGAA